MFFFFSNRMGCLPSLLLSAVVTLVLLFVTGVAVTRPFRLSLRAKTTRHTKGK